MEEILLATANDQMVFSYRSSALINIKSLHIRCLWALKTDIFFVCILHSLAICPQEELQPYLFSSLNYNTFFTDFILLTHVVTKGQSKC